MNIIMEHQEKMEEIVNLWEADKKNYVKKSTLSAYMLLIENHLLPAFGNATIVEEEEVQKFVFQKLNEGLSQKSVKDILIVLKMLLKFGAKNKLIEYKPFDIQFPTVRVKQEIDVLTKTNQKKL